MTGEVDPERLGSQVYPNLVTLLKASSNHFATNIGKQVFKLSYTTHAPSVCIHCIFYNTLLI